MIVQMFQVLNMETEMFLNVFSAGRERVNYSI